MDSPIESRYACTTRIILERINNSKVPEDLRHAKNTVKWVKKLNQREDPLLELAALGHDIERALKTRKAKREDFESYDDYKDAHAQYSARIIAEIMKQCGWDRASIEKVSRTVALHERGGNLEADLLKDADSLSFFEVNLPYYYERNSRHEVVKRCVWGLKRLSPHLRQLLEGFVYENPDIASIVKEVMKTQG